MVRMNWKKAQKPRAIEEKYDDGKVLRNGRMVVKQQDSMQRRAAMVERQWLKKVGISSKIK